MMRSFFFSLICSLLYLTLNAQDETEGVEYARWNINPSIGYQFPSWGFNQNDDIDVFYSTSSSDLRWQVISFDVFIRKQWGFSLVVPMTAVSDNAYESAVQKFLKKQFGDNYFFNELNSGNSNTSFLAGILIGPTYRFEKDAFYLQGKLLFGVTEFLLPNIEVYLKEKNSNYVDQYTLEAQPSNSSNFTFSPSFLAGYKAYERFVLNLSLQYSLFKQNTTVTETYTDLYANQTTESRYRYSEMVNTLSLSFGIVFEFNRKVRDK